MNIGTPSKVTGGSTTKHFDARGTRFIVVALSLALVLVFDSPVSKAQTLSEYQVKAIYLYNFTKFVEWPDEAFEGDTVPFIVGVMGDDSFSTVIEETINGKTINGRRLIVKRLKWGENLRVCHILYISSYEQRHLTHILESLKGTSILTVGEMDHFTQQGGIINLVTEDNTVMFEVNLGVADHVRLKISSKLLALAKNVIGKRRAGKSEK